ncbi:MAG: DUF2782 domain-containing protein [Gammaproteobacteria bacterium]|nr:DUF2782 domain-containing protein [Gammaproteobacteria bacterium]MCW8983518.1 DUF2782 domain-containing protein [Gammaproteobacteria bacterium]
MRLIISSFFILWLGLSPLQAFGAGAGDAQIPPPLPESLQEQALESEVTIIRRKETLIEEYRQNGILYMIKITPKRGYPYYLIDSDGDGSLETRRNELDNPEVVQWRLFSW